MGFLALVVGGLTTWGWGRSGLWRKSTEKSERVTVFRAAARRDAEQPGLAPAVGTDAGEAWRADIIEEQIRKHQSNAVEDLPDEFFLSHLRADTPGADELVLRQLGAGGAVTFAPAQLDLRLFRWRVRESAGGAPLLSVQGGAFSPATARLKRWLDALAAMFALVLISPLLILVAACIWAVDGGPVLFRQERIGRGGRPFKLLKFRTMRRDAEALLMRDAALYERYVANNFKLPLNDDIRVTRLGRFLRASSLDELPQLLNVLKGDMSLVGPRPVVPAEVAKFGVFATLILSVRPGLTGLWQVKGRSLIGDYEERVRLNLEYLRDASLHRDFAIMARTVLVVLRLKDAGWQRGGSGGATGSSIAPSPAINRDELLIDQPQHGAQISTSC